MLRWIVRGAAATVLVAAALVLGLHLGGTDTSQSGMSSGGSFLLSAPALAQTSGSDEFPHNEVGICAYVNLGDSIDLVRAEAAFSGVEANEEAYIIGTVSLPNLAEDMWPHVYISSDGWIIAYYPKTEPTSRIVQWVGYQQGEVSTTTLRDALVQVAQQSGLTTSRVLSALGYYHFQYPTASKLLIAVDTTTGTDTFSYTLPSSLNLYDASWSHFAADASSTYGTNTEIDSVRVFSGGGGTYIACGTLDTQFKAPETAHVVQVYCTRSWAGAAIVFLHD